MAAKVRIEPHDDYPTHVADARYLISLLPIKPGSRILEPHANKGNFVRALQLEVPTAQIFANELQDKYIPRLERILPPRNVRHGDFLSITPPKRVLPFDWIIGNPPFSGNTGIIHTLHALSLAHNVAFFLPLRYMSSGKRFHFWKKHKGKHIWSIAERPVFVGGRGGRTDYAFYWWRHGYSGPTKITMVSLLEP